MTRLLLQLLHTTTATATTTMSETTTTAAPCFCGDVKCDWKATCCGSGKKFSVFIYVNFNLIYQFLFL